MKVRKTLRNLAIVAIVMCNIGCDQISKTIVRHEIQSGESFSFLYNHFTLLKVENTGAFLSLGNSLPFFVKLFLLIVLPLVAMLSGVFFLLIKRNMPIGVVVGACFVIGGGIGNLYDRILYGSVTDFMHIDFGLFQTGIFNLADVSIMIGIAIIFIVSQRNKHIFHKVNIG